LTDLFDMIFFSSIKDDIRIIRKINIKKLFYYRKKVDKGRRGHIVTKY